MSPHDRKDQHCQRELGMQKFTEIHPSGAEAMIAAVNEISPDFANYLLEFPFGDIYSRPGLDLRTRQIATISALTTLGYALPQLKVHIQIGLNAGLSQQEIIEIIMQMSVYAGFPAALNALFSAKEVFDSVQKTD